MNQMRRFRVYLVLVYCLRITANSSSVTTLTGSNTTLPKGCEVDMLPNGDCVLNCKGGDIKQILPAIRGLGENFTHIVVSNCQTSISNIIFIDASVFKNMTSLQHVYITECEIGMILPGTFAGLNISYIELRGNALSIVSKNDFRGLHNLRYLGLAGQKSLRSIDVDAFKETPNIVYMYLNDNKELRLSPYYPYNSTRVFRGLTKLQVLQLSNVGMLGLSTDEKALAIFLKDQASSLRELYLSINEMTNYHLPMLRNLRRLQKLDLGHNNIGYINTLSLPMLRGTSLELNDNSILFFETGALGRMVNVTLDIRHNPIICDCENMPFAARLRDQSGSVKFLDAGNLTCGGPRNMYGTKVVHYDPNWWTCTPYFPIIALVFIVGFVLIVAAIFVVIYCNWVNIKHWRLERRELASSNEEDQDRDPAETDPLYQPIAKRNSLRQGKTGAFVLYNYKDKVVLTWANKYLDDNLHNHTMKITLQWSAGPEAIPLWKQVKDFSPQVNAFLVLVTDEFLDNHWPEIAEKSGVENIMKFVLVLFGGKRKRELPKGLKRLGCPCLEWLDEGTKRSRDQFWKELRIHLKGISQ